MPPQFVFSTQRLGRSFGEKVVFQGISLSFYYGAKIGIVGENGSGKSTLLRIMAGVDREFDGEAELAKGMRVGYVAQEPVLDLDATVRENLRRAVAPIQGLIDRFNEISAKLGEPIEPDEMERLLAEMGRLQERIDACSGW
ncbi:MAG: ATP-binding cassette domain-containing protein, partial [Planctomycetes bacterium]|nr:ATP-binding cassette domain-containing protein [Planctomycetota bacterium]